MTYIYTSRDYSYCYQGFDPINRALGRKGIEGHAHFAHPHQMRVEVPLGTPADVVNQVVTKVQKRFPARPLTASIE